MVQQYAKFNKIAIETQWRADVASLNYLETSTLWRQEQYVPSSSLVLSSFHLADEWISNGYSHQNPGFISSVLELPNHMVRVYFPPDAATTVNVMAHCLRSKNCVNLVSGL